MKNTIAAVYFRSHKTSAQITFQITKKNKQYWAMGILILAGFMKRSFSLNVSVFINVSNCIDTPFIKAHPHNFHKKFPTLFSNFGFIASSVPQVILLLNWNRLSVVCHAHCLLMLRLNTGLCVSVCLFEFLSQ